jgi:hypothetical protein
MMRIQYEKIIEELYRILDEELDIETREGRDVFRAMSLKLFDIYAKQEREKRERKALVSTDPKLN